MVQNYPPVRCHCAAFTNLKKDFLAFQKLRSVFNMVSSRQRRLHLGDWRCIPHENQRCCYFPSQRSLGRVRFPTRGPGFPAPGYLPRVQPTGMGAFRRPAIPSRPCMWKSKPMKVSAACLARSKPRALSSSPIFCAHF